jgi:hypothetical protein
MLGQTPIPSSQNVVAESIQKDPILSLAEQLDFLNIQILRKFYATGQAFPHDTQPHVFSVLYMEMKMTSRIQIGLEAFRKRLDSLTKMGLLKKVTRSSPACYQPVKGIEASIRAVIKRFLINNNLQYIP